MRLVTFVTLDGDEELGPVVVVVLDPAPAVPEAVAGELVPEAVDDVAAVPPALDEAAPVDDVAARDGVNRPVRFQKAENPLNGPPTTWLDHCRVNAPVAAL